MIYADYTNLQTPLRSIKGKVVVDNSTATFSNTDALKSFKIERIGESGKFFGFGVSQKLTVNLLDKNREIDMVDNAVLVPYLTTEDEYETTAIKTAFTININETKRNEKTNELTVVAYDNLATAANHTFNELELTTPYTIGDVASACASILGLSYSNSLDGFSLEFAEGANFEGTETIRDVLDDVAEATQTIYFVYDGGLIFKRLGTTTDLTINKSLYFELEANEPVTLAAIASVTELGDNVEEKSTITTGVTQYIRDNDFIALREDVATILKNGFALVDGTTITPFACSWRGNYFLEIGDKIALETKNGGLITSYVLNDVIEYNGALKQKTQWKYEKKETTPTNPTTLGEALKQTFAKVDKAEKRIDIVAGETSANNSSISSIQADTENINLIVEKIEKKQEEDKEALEGSIETLTNRVDLAMTSEDVTIAIQSELDNGVAKVATEKGFIFDNAGLTIEERDSEGNRISETSTQITENGMQVFDNNDEAVLTANNNGVNAVNLHATTYLIIGNNSRFEDYGDNRTGCFWIGGNN